MAHWRHWRISVTVKLEQCPKVASGGRYLSRLGRPVLNGLATLEFVFRIPDDGLH